MTDTDTSAAPNHVLAPAGKDTLVRFGFVALLLLGGGLWFAYDGYIAKVEDAQGNLKPKYEYAAPGEDINQFGDWLFNAVIGPFVMVPAGLIIAGVAFRSATRHIEADESGIGYVGKEKIPWNKICRVDAADLAAKQILRLDYGAEKPLTLDAYKLNNFKALIAFVDEHTPESAKPALDGADGPADDTAASDPES